MSSNFPIVVKQYLLTYLCLMCPELCLLFSASTICGGHELPFRPFLSTDCHVLLLCCLIFCLIGILCIILCLQLLKYWITSRCRVRQICGVLEQWPMLCKCLCVCVYKLSVLVVFVIYWMEIIRNFRLNSEIW